MLYWNNTTYMVLLNTVPAWYTQPNKITNNIHVTVNNNWHGLLAPIFAIKLALPLKCYKMLRIIVTYLGRVT